MNADKLSTHPGPSRFPLAADLALAVASLALGFAIFGQPGIWRQAIFGTSIAGAILLLLFRQTVEWREGPLARIKTWGLYIMAGFLLLSAASVPNHRVIDAGSDYRVPYQLPGPMDHWSEGMATEITVETSGTRGALVTLNLHESHDTLPPIMAVYGGSCHEERFDVIPGGGAVYPHWREKGKPSSYPSQVDQECFSPKNNKVIFRPITGSWVAVKSVDILELPYWNEPWRQVTEPWSWIFFWLALFMIVLDRVLGWPRDQAPKRLLFGAGMGALVLAMIALSLVSTAAYVEARHKWLVKQEGEFRSAEMFYSSKFIRDAELGWRLLPGFTGKTLEEGGGSPSLFYYINKHGFRALDREPEFPPKGKAMALGDSFTQGIFLSQEETIPAVMSRKMGGYVYNFGVGGFSTDQQYTTFIKWVDKVEAEAAVVLYYANDALFTMSPEGHSFSKPVYAMANGVVDFDRLEKLSESMVERENAQLLADPEMEKIFCCFSRKNPGTAERTLHTFGRYLSLGYYPGRLLGAISGDIAKTRSTPAPRHMDVDHNLLANPDAFKAGLDASVQFLVRMNQECKKRKMKFLVVYVPDISRISNPDKPELGNFQKAFAKACAANGLPMLDPSEALIAQNRRNGAYFLDDGHFSPNGARIVGEMIADALAKK